MTKPRFTHLLLFILASLASKTCSAQCMGASFEEQDGLAVIEFESASFAAGWNFQDKHSWLHWIFFSRMEQDLGALVLLAAMDSENIKSRSTRLEHTSLTLGAELRKETVTPSLMMHG